MTDIFALIPARRDSSRFPGKPLALISGKPMIQRVYERAGLIDGVKGVWVATDAPEIYDKVVEFGGKVIMTKNTHLSGSDRLAEASRVLGINNDDIVLNIQGDQPVLDPSHAKQLCRALVRCPDCAAATLAIPFENDGEAENPNHVKVVFDNDGRAVYFSRHPIPYEVDRAREIQRYRHVGVYAFRAGFLYRFVTLPRGPLESSESLEQLRILENGHRIKVVITQGLSPEVDVPEDIPKAERALAEEESKKKTSPEEKNE
ncbi:MAG: 3-deoxy-manno-octulosonate cytidylyltransferase [Deltaproteobacteria bacterium]|jgi:3-deoxy-manno-octulosonate cytidylyltransferase (CMP-KDO synthetase)|nr:3-deoxy-manno-octulosonate cytidylyltransferase [Deltaproteobacteria bacterium]